MKRLRAFIILTLIRSLFLVFLSSSSMATESAEKRQQQTTPDIKQSQLLDRAERDYFRRWGAIPAKFTFQDLAFRAAFHSKDRRPDSRWQNAQKDKYKKLLKNSSYDLMVVPFQVARFAFDRPTRSLMTAELTYAIADKTGLSLPDPYLLFRALGEYERTFDHVKVNQLASELGVKRIVWAHVGHDRNNQMDLMVQVLDGWQKPTKTIKPRAGSGFYKIPFSSENPPIDVFHSLLPKILSSLDLSVNKQKSKAVDIVEQEVALPESPSGMFANASGNNILNAHYFQFLAYLTPKYAERARERFIEKSLLALYETPATFPQYRALKARAYMQLGLRPAALKILESPVSKEEKAIFQALQGNLTEVTEITPNIESKMGKIFGLFDKNAIAAKYQILNSAQSEDNAKSLQLPGSIWPFLAYRSMVDWDDWSQFNNAQLKLLLDHEFPIANYSLDDIVAGINALDDVTSADSLVDLSVTEHINKLIKTEPERWSVKAISNSLMPSDYIDLIEAVAVDNLMRRGKFLVYTQGSPVRAQHFLESIAVLFGGHPQYTLYRGMVRKELADRKRGAESESLLKAAYLDAFDAFYWSKGQTRVASDAFNLTKELMRNDVRYYGNPYSSDYPYRSFYTTWESSQWVREDKIKNLFAALLYSTDDYSPVQSLSILLNQKPERVNAMLNSIKDRFHGNPLYFTHMAFHAVNSGRSHEAMDYYKKGIVAVPGEWENYSLLGTIQFEDGNIEEAYKTFLSWPGFDATSDINRVMISNNAYVAGSAFYWGGYFDQAKRLYRISADLKTGSVGSIASALRLQILDGNLRLAMEGMQRRAQRYNSSYAYRDYLGMLHATGRGKQAWSAFNYLVDRQNQPHIWETALTGHHFEGADESDVLAWIDGYKNYLSKQGDNYASNYLLRFGVTDRIPSDGLIKRIENIDNPVMFAEEGTYVYRYSPDRRYRIPQTIRLTKGSDFAAKLKDKLKSSADKRVKSSLAYFAESYRFIRSGEYPKAAKNLREAVSIYNTVYGAHGYLLPYYAYSSARTGDVSDAEEILAHFTPDNYSFDYHLAKAVLAGIKGDHKRSLKYLDLALHRRPHTEYRPIFTEYQYAEICELLYEATGNEKYKQILLDWAKKVERYFPWYSWAYTMQAKYSADPIERGRAIAIGYYLDRKSERLKSIPQSEIQSSLTKYKHLNPFIFKSQPGNKQTTTLNRTSMNLLLKCGFYLQLAEANQIHGRFLHRAEKWS